MSAGNYQCYRCPDHSYTNVPQSVECTCDEGFYRSPADKKDTPCTRMYSLMYGLGACVTVGLSFFIPENVKVGISHC